MIRTVPPYSPPAAPALTGKLAQDFANFRNYIVNQLLPYQFNYHSNHANAFNNGSQGEGSPLPAGATLYPSAFIHHVSGSATVTTIAVPVNFPFAGQLTLIADNGFTIQTGGNIAHSKTLAAGDVATLTYSQQSQTWYLIAVISTLADLPDESAWSPNNPYLLSDSIIDPNGNLQQVTTAGTSGASAPTWNATLNGTTNDATPLVWTNKGPPATSATRYTVRSIDVNHRSMVDMTQAHPAKSNVVAIGSPGVDSSGNVQTAGLALGAVNNFATFTRASMTLPIGTWTLVGSVTISVAEANDPILLNIQGLCSGAGVQTEVSTDAGRTSVVAGNVVVPNVDNYFSNPFISQSLAPGNATYYFWVFHASASITLSNLAIYANDQRR